MLCLAEDAALPSFRKATNIPWPESQRVPSSRHDLLRLVVGRIARTQGGTRVGSAKSRFWSCSHTNP